MAICAGWLRFWVNRFRVEDLGGFPGQKADIATNPASTVLNQANATANTQIRSDLPCLGT
ncbi:hypothetical protein MC7420_4276 [Coleofasciculus chthonoplastes PCC 7420]|uniref:Uncharacterized protein n=1 Tax=Coleofasciculus chthonoplastes PCC 7420 TaxID=118168 RepID=B4W419_9CYAN|nr:hypothetical protein MC7420_4276 [Coleofasciculus chthonoplastes PCC 7420]